MTQHLLVQTACRTVPVLSIRVESVYPGRPNWAVRVVDQRTLAGGIAHISMSEDIRTWMRTSELSDMEAHCVTPYKAAVGVILSIPGYNE